MPDGCKYFSARAAPQVGPNGSKVHNKKNLTSSDTPNRRYSHLSQPQNAHFFPPVGKRGSSFKNSLGGTLKHLQFVVISKELLSPLPSATSICSRSFEQAIKLVTCGLFFDSNLLLSLLVLTQFRFSRQTFSCSWGWVA